MDENKVKAIDNAINQIEKNFGKSKPKLEEFIRQKLN